MRLKLVILALLLLTPLARAVDPTWTHAFPPFRIAGNLYYVGSEELAAFLITTPQGNILVNSNLTSSPAQLRHSVEKLGFRWSDTKVLLISHAHSDHAAGSAAILQQTHAKYEVMDGDIPAIESGGRSDFALGKQKQYQYPAAHADRILHDGDTVSLGGTVLTAHKTAGHTKGCTTWTMDVTEAGKTLHVVIIGSPNVLSSYKLINNKAYPQIADDFRHQFELLRALPCDIFLGAHASYFDLKQKYTRLQSGDKNAFIDPAGYKAFVAEKQRDFESALEKQTRKN
ncbi:subclass B3 metallo-beta-lactamase [Occallatibacter riparius]|uniref:Subclass B3 metallo-beta-lactamase n=1 Tax=Occallatibacter riparius TaxID=1002689 RepID=A0A9J7BLC3_9BACT|nr:subclass B3 metallo-beta-lactamase [Occallatibacter riparius]UWZ82037.1 subclass B3 metallo-beta-lactamase [Occallatibacter riparius]